MLVRKILETTLAAGSTSVSFTDSDILNSLIRVYSTDPDLMPVEQSLTGTTLTITYEAQSSAKGIAVEMVKQGLEIVDNLTSSDTDKALSAKQGKVLKDAIDDIVIPTVPESITDLDDVIFTDPTNGQVLKYQNGIIVNGDESGGGSGVDVIDFEWTASSSSAVKTALTESKTLNAGKYVGIIHTPYGTNVSNFQFMILVDGDYVYNTSILTNSSYTSMTVYFDLSESASVCLGSATNTSVTWDSLYLSEGGMRVLKVGDN